MVWPDADRGDYKYETPAKAALAQPRRLDQKPRLVSVEVRDDSHADVEVDMGRHPADRVLYRCSREEDGRWWVEGDSHWFDETPVNVEAALPSEDLGLYIVESPIGGYELMVTGYDFRSTHVSHHSTIDDAKAYAYKKYRSGLAWQPWSIPEAGT